jgi:hypothetical protein
MPILNRFTGLITGLVTGMLVLTPAPATAHGEGVLKVGSRQLVAGSTLRIAGEEFGGGAKLTLVLVGVRGRFELGEVATDSAGAFANEFAVPGDLPNGAYRLVAVASDGDEVATLDVAVAAVAPLGEPGATDEEERSVPTAEPLELDRAGSPWVKGGTVVAIVIAIVTGGALLRRPGEAT